MTKNKKPAGVSEVIGGCALMIALTVFVFVLASVAFMWGWNEFAVAAFGANQIDLIDAVAGLVLISVSGGLFTWKRVK